MCGIAKRGSKTFFPGVTTNIVTPRGIVRKRWGDKTWQYYNARGEKLYTTWKSWLSNRCILEVDTFFEKKVPFSRNINETMLLGGLYNDEQFVIITQPSSKIIAEVHHRMPLIVNNAIDHFLYDNNISLNDFSFNNDKLVKYEKLNLSKVLEYEYY